MLQEIQLHTTGTIPKFSPPSLRHHPVPQAGLKLMAHLGAKYKDEDWRLSLKAVMDAENDSVKALKSLDALTMKIFGQPIAQVSLVSVPTHSDHPQYDQHRTHISEPLEFDKRPTQTILMSRRKTLLRDLLHSDKINRKFKVNLNSIWKY